MILPARSPMVDSVRGGALSRGAITHFRPKHRGKTSTTDNFALARSSLSDFLQRSKKTQDRDHASGERIGFDGVGGEPLAAPGNNPRWNEAAGLLGSIPRLILVYSRASQATPLRTFEVRQSWRYATSIGQRISYALSERTRFFALPGVTQSLHPGLSPLTPSAYNDSPRLSFRRRSGVLSQSVPDHSDFFRPTTRRHRRTSKEDETR